MMNNMEEFSYICKVDELKNSEGKRFYINDTDVAIFKLNDNIYAVSNICPHKQTPNIYEGFLEDNCVVCPLHGWKFSLVDGKLLTGGRGLDSYPVKVVDGKVYGKIFPKKLNW